MWLNPEFDRERGEHTHTDASESGGVNTSAATASAPTSTSSVTAGGASAGGVPCQRDQDCDNGLFCDGAELCAPDAADIDAFGCIPGFAPCTPPELCAELDQLCSVPCEVDSDRDDDGADNITCGGSDCDDTDPAIHPGAPEICAPDTVDEDCDPTTFGALDADADGKISQACCNLNEGALHCGDDCNDAFPGLGIGDWAHCGACGTSCGVQQACEAGACVAARRVFMTSATHDGNMGGVLGADALCQASADGAALGGTFKAYIVDQSADLNRLEHPALPFIRLDGVRVANDWNDLADESLHAPLNLTEARTTPQSNAWTGLTNVVGSPINNHCNNWTSTVMCTAQSPCGGGGEVATIDNHWDGFHIYSCYDQNRLYCIEQ